MQKKSAILKLVVISTMIILSKSINTNCTVDKCIVCPDPKNLTCTNCAEGYYLKSFSGGDRKYVACWSTTKLILSLLGGLLGSLLTCGLCYLCYKLGENEKKKGFGSKKQSQRESRRESRAPSRGQSVRDSYIDKSYREGRSRNISRRVSPQRSPSGSPGGVDLSPTRRTRYVNEKSPRPIKLSNQNIRSPDRYGPRAPERRLPGPSVVRKSQALPRRVIRNQPGVRSPGYVTPPDEPKFREVSPKRRVIQDSRVPRRVRDPIRDITETEEDLQRIDRVDRRVSPDRERPSRAIRGYKGTRESDIGVTEPAEKYPRA